MTTKILRLSALGIFLGTTSLLRAAIAPAENLLPADTLAFYTVPDCTAFRAACKTSPQLMFWNDPAMKAVHDKFMGKFNERFIAPLEKDLGIKTDDFLAVLQGQLTVGITVNGSNGKDEVPPGIVLLLDAKNKSDTLKTNLATLTKKWTTAGRALRTEKIHGLPFTVVPLSSNDLAAFFPKRKKAVTDDNKEAKTPPNEIYLCQYQSLLVAANSAKVAESVAGHLTGGSAPAIDSDPVFAADKLSQFRDSPLHYGWFNAVKFFGLLTVGSKEDDDADPAMMPKFSATKILGATGLDGLKSASFAVREQPEGSTVTLHLTAPESARNGLIKILALPAKDSSIPAFVPGDAVKFTRVRIDGKQTWTDLQKIISNISPQYLASLNGVIDMANAMAQSKNPAFDLRTYLFGNLRDDLITYQKPAVDDTLAAMANPPTLFLLSVTDTDQAIEAIKTIAGMSAPQDSANKPREIQGHKIYTVALRPTRTADGNTKPNSLYLSSANGYLGISKDAGVLEEFLRSAEAKGRPLRDMPGIAEAASRVGAMNGGLFTYENQRETMRLAFKLLKNPDTSTGILRMFPPEFRDWTDFTLLPEFDQISKYFYMSVSGASVNSEGMTLKIFNPRSPQLK